ncbi:hypothetical protein [Burkholderia stagnalis]|nr:hypothetical protein [Burkholderia stagnalis]
MALVKVWIGALVAVSLFLYLQAVLQQKSEQIERTPVVRRV